MSKRNQMNQSRADFMTAWRGARLTGRAGKKEEDGLGIVLRAKHGAARFDDETKCAYATLLRYGGDSSRSKTDRRFYLMRARAIRLANFRDLYAGIPAARAAWLGKQTHKDS